MLVYFAAAYTCSFYKNSSGYNLRLNDAEREKHENIMVNLLSSYHYMRTDASVQKVVQSERQVFIDSGAFSAYTKGIEVDVLEYVRFCKKWDSIIRKDGGALLASVLDVIGDPVGTYRNQKIMEENGITPLPCYHYGEDTKVLDYYVENYEYITIGGMVPISTPQLRLWLDRLWAHHLTDEQGRPKIKIHGFGLTAVDLLFRYPWYSVDSSSWIQVAAVGNIYTGKRGLILPISDMSPAAKIRERHFDNLAPAQQEAIVYEIESKGFELQRIRENHYVRFLYNCQFFHDLSIELAAKQTTFHAQFKGLFDGN